MNQNGVYMEKCNVKCHCFGVFTNIWRNFRFLVWIFERQRNKYKYFVLSYENLEQSLIIADSAQYSFGKLSIVIPVEDTTKKLGPALKSPPLQNSQAVSFPLD